MGGGRLAVGSGRWAVGGGRWAVGGGQTCSWPNTTRSTLERFSMALSEPLTTAFAPCVGSALACKSGARGALRQTRRWEAGLGCARGTGVPGCAPSVRRQAASSSARRRSRSASTPIGRAPSRRRASSSRGSAPRARLARRSATHHSRRWRVHRRQARWSLHEANHSTLARPLENLRFGRACLGGARTGQRHVRMASDGRRL